MGLLFRLSANSMVQRLSAGLRHCAGFTLEGDGEAFPGFWLTSEDLPDRNRVTLDKNGRVVLRYTPNNIKAHEKLQATLKEAPEEQRACRVHGHECREPLCPESLSGQQIPLAGVATRMELCGSVSIPKHLY